MWELAQNQPLDQLVSHHAHVVRGRVVARLAEEKRVLRLAHARHQLVQAVLEHLASGAAMTHLEAIQAVQGGIYVE